MLKKQRKIKYFSLFYSKMNKILIKFSIIQQYLICFLIFFMIDADMIANGST